MTRDKALSKHLLLYERRMRIEVWFTPATVKVSRPRPVKSVASKLDWKMQRVFIVALIALVALAPALVAAKKVR